MELFGKPITRREVLQGTGIAAGAAAIITALALWGNKDFTIGISSKTLCDDNNPELVSSVGSVMQGFGAAETDLIARAHDSTGTKRLQANARVALLLLATKDGQGRYYFESITPDKMTCTVETKEGDRTALTSDAEETIGMLGSAGVRVEIK